MSDPGLLAAAGGFLLHDAGGRLLTALVCGHVLGDFVFQTRGVVERKRESRRVCAGHALAVTLLQLACVAPWWSVPLVCGLFLVGIAHFLVDLYKARLQRRHGFGLTLFAADQLAHQLCLGALWWYWTESSRAGWFAPSDALLAGWTRAAFVLLVFGFNCNGAGAVVAHVIRWVRREREPADERGEAEADPAVNAGRVIGILERVLVLLLVWPGHWGTVGMVIAAKSIARFKRLEEDQEFAEAYIVGTLASMACAVLGGMALARFV